jgi:hypothetical protein
VKLLGLAAVCAAGVAAAVALLRAPPAGRARAAAARAAAARAATGHAGAVASSRGPLESMFQDDQLLLDSPTATVTRTLDELRGLGVDRLRLTVLWSSIAPDPLGAHPPAGFDPAQPGAYPAAAWAPYDRVLALARARGIGVDFDLTAPGPRWAMAPGAPVAAQANHYAPSAPAFGAFVRAVGRRYSGSYRPAGAAEPLPRVGFWSIWNEPNQPGWLAPQWQTRGASPAIAAARLYRGYVDAATAALASTGHRRDTVLIGELAPEGDERPGESSPVPPLPFLRALYCVGSTYAPLHGDAAAALGCPTDGAPASFAAAHPGLFEATGFAHHPYSFFLAPARSMSDPNFVPLADLGRLERGLDAIFAAYAVPRRLPIYLTEYGYETNPPNPFRGVAPATQAADLDEAEYLAWLDPRVRALSQFELRDSAPNRAFRPGTVRYWSTFQTGLEYLDGRAKPSLAAYPLPIFIPVPRFIPGGTVRLWAMLRAAANGAAQRAQIQWRAPEGAWRTLAVARTRDAGGVLLSTVSPPGSGLIRVAWAPPSGRLVVSRSVPVIG